MKKLTQQHIAAAQSRRRQLLAWEETARRLAATPARTDEERLAKFQAQRLLEQARP